MKTTTTKKILPFILLLCGMFSSFLADAQSCRSNQQLMFRCFSTIDCRTQCVTAKNVQRYLSKGWAYGPCPQYCILFRLAQPGETEVPADLLIYPNPVSTSTTLSFYINQPKPVSIRIFDVDGRLVSTLANSNFEEGSHELVWDATDVRAGIYFLKFQSGDDWQTEKLIVTK